ncbi:MAG: tetratricopeptide repeat protein [Rhodobiaceae bacterium]|nr:tetratricopeptide repeat protein [Rhodobiaceae bacterium]
MRKSVLSRSALAAFIFLAGPLTLHPAWAEESAEPLVGRTFSGNYLAGRLAYSVNDTVAAATFFRSALSLDDGNALYDETLRLEIEAGHENQAVQLADRMIKTDQSNKLARVILATRALRSRQYAEARKHLAETAGTPLTDLTAGLINAWTFAGARDAKGAASAIDAIAENGSAEIAKLKAYHAGLIAETLGDRQKAEAQYAKAYDPDNKVLRVTQAYARVLMANGKADEARKMLGEFNAALPGHPLIEQEMASIAEGRVPQGDILTAQDGAAEVYYGLGAALGQDAADGFGTIYLQLAMMLKPEFPLALIALANYIEGSGNYERAIEVYDRVPPSSPLAYSVAIARARDLADLDRTDEAVDALKKLSAAEPAKRDAAVALGDILRDAERFGEAAVAYSTAIDRAAPIDRSDWVLFYFRGMSYERAKEWPKAEADLQKALELEPDHPFVLNYLGYSWVDQGLHLDKALKMIEKAVELRPNDGYIVDSLGWAYYKLGRWEEAVTQLERAVQLRPQDAILNDHLGDAYWRAGRKFEARFQWNHARDLDPDADTLATILKKIESGLPDDPGATRAAKNGDGG